LYIWWLLYLITIYPIQGSKNPTLHYEHFAFHLYSNSIISMWGSSKSTKFCNPFCFAGGNNWDDSNIVNLSTTKSSYWHFDLAGLSWYRNQGNLRTSNLFSTHGLSCVDGNQLSLSTFFHGTTICPVSPNFSLPLGKITLFSLHTEEQ
jgi:hypothetical protein